MVRKQLAQLQAVRASCTNDRGVVIAKIARLLDDRRVDANSLRTIRCSDTVFSVSSLCSSSTYQVDLDPPGEKGATCTCLIPNQCGVPCHHVMAAVKREGSLLTDMGAFYEKFVDKVYFSAYFQRAVGSMTAYMPAGRGLEDVLPMSTDPVIIAPPNKVRRGRKPSKKRRRSRGECTPRQIYVSNKAAQLSPIQSQIH